MTVKYFLKVLGKLSTCPVILHKTVYNSLPFNLHNSQLIKYLFTYFFCDFLTCISDFLLFFIYPIIFSFLFVFRVSHS